MAEPHPCVQMCSVSLAPPLHRRDISDLELPKRNLPGQGQQGKGVSWEIRGENREGRVLKAGREGWIKQGGMDRAGKGKDG